MNPFRTLLAIGALAVLMSCGRPSSPPQSKILDPALAPQLQAIAIAACQCARDRPGKDPACWADFERATNGAERSQYATACAPVSSEGECFNNDTPHEFCIYMGSHSPAGRLCTGKEMEIVDATYMRVYSAGRDHTAARAAAAAALRTHLRGEQVAGYGPDEGGCGGGAPPRIPPPPEMSS